jgi:hypothetical protein
MVPFTAIDVQLRARQRFSCEVRAELVRLPFVKRKCILW